MGVIFNSISLAKALESSYIVNAFVEHSPNFVLAEPDIQVTHVPGRNGDVIYDDGSYQNVLIKYDIAIRAKVEALGSPFTNFQSTVQGLISRWLYPAAKSADGYYTLRDTYDVGHWRKARPYGKFELKNVYGQNARGTLTFNCRPERYLVTQPLMKQINPPGGTLDNSSFYFPAKPYLFVKITNGGSGAFAFYQTGGNMYRVQIDNAPDTDIYLNCETQEATLSDGTNVNSYVTVTGTGYFPILEPGITQNVAITGDILGIQIRDWRLWEI